MAAFKANGVEIIDIQREKLDESLVETMMQCLDPENGKEKSMPTLLLYDGKTLVSDLVTVTLTISRERTQAL